MEILLAISGFIVGIIVSPALVKWWKYEAHDEIKLLKEKGIYGINPETGGAIFHPIPKIVKREQRKIEEARRQGRDSVPLDEI